MNKLEQVENFAAFIDFLSNPQEYKNLIGEIRQTILAYEKYKNETRKISSIDMWRAEEEAKYNSFNKQHEDRVKLFDIQAKEFEEKLQLSNNQIKIAHGELASQTKKLDERSKVIEAIEIEKKKVEESYNELQNKLKEVKEMREALKLKTLAIQEVLKG